MTKEIPMPNVQTGRLVRWHIRRLSPQKRTGLKGRHNKAQGNALGIAAPNSPALKGRKRAMSFAARRAGADSIPPLQGFRSETGVTPRALPWALLWLPLRGARPELAEALYKDDLRAQTNSSP